MSFDLTGTTYREASMRTPPAAPRLYPIHSGSGN